MENPTITVEDLTNIIKLIDVCAKRGTFNGDELATVGALRTKVLEFVLANTPATPAPEAASETPVEGSESE